MFQFLFGGLPSRRVQPTNLLPTGVVITSNNHHRRLLPAQCFGPPTQAYSATNGAFVLIQSSLWGVPDGAPWTDNTIATRPLGVTMVVFGCPVLEDFQGRVLVCSPMPKG